MNEDLLTPGERVSIEAWRKERWHPWIIAIIDRLAPKLKEHAKCPACGREASAGWQDALTHMFHAACRCGVAGPYADTQDGAWREWDRVMGEER